MNDSHPKRMFLVATLVVMFLAGTLYLVAKPVSPNSVPVPPGPAAKLSNAVPPESASSTEPKITWSSKSTEVILSRGESTSQDFTFVSNLNLQNVVVVVAVPEIAGFLTIQPNAFANVPAGQPQAIHISFTIPTNTALGTYAGTIHVRSASSTLSQTLKVVVAISQTPIILQVPQNFQPNTEVISQGGPILLNNFGSQYQHGGLVPRGGAEISITTNPNPTPPLSNYISNELDGASITSTSTIVVSSTSCTEVFYSDSYGQGYNYSNVAVYCPHDKTLYKLFLNYTAGDPAAGQFLNALQQVLNTIQFTL